MKITKFLNIKIDPPPLEVELDVELQCRYIMKSNDIDSIKRFCTHLVRKKFDQDILLAALLEKLVDLESKKIIKDQEEKSLSSKPSILSRSSLNFNTAFLIGDLIQLLSITSSALPSLFINT